MHEGYCCWWLGLSMPFLQPFQSFNTALNARPDREPKTSSSDHVNFD